MGYWETEYHLIDKTGRNVCTVFFDDESKSWCFVDFRGRSDFGFATSEKAITYCDEYMWNAYGIC